MYKITSSAPRNQAWGAIPNLAARPGETRQLVTLWRLRDPAVLDPVHPTDYGREAAIIVYLLDGAGGFSAEQDRLDALAWNWQAGDSFARMLRPALAAGLAPAECRTEVGLNTRPRLRRVPVLGPDDEPARDVGQPGTVIVAP